MNTQPFQILSPNLLLSYPGGEEINADLVRVLVDKNRGRNIMRQTNEGKPPLHIALEQKVSKEIIEILMNVFRKQSYDEINTIYKKRVLLHTDNEHGDTVLHYACKFGASLDIFELLLFDDQKEEENKNLIRKENNEGENILHYTCKYNLNLDALKLLVEKGGRKALKSNQTGKMPFETACSNKK